MWVIQRKQDNAIVGSTDAPETATAEEVVRCYNGTVGLKEDSDVFKAGWVPVQSWKSMSQTWTPMHEVVPDDGFRSLAILVDGSETSDREVSVDINVSGHQIWLRVEGYGEPLAQNGHGSPIGVELYDGDLRVLAWSDINVQDPQVINMESARESNRQPEGDYDDTQDCKESGNHLTSCDSDGFCNNCGDQ